MIKAHPSKLFVIILILNIILTNPIFSETAAVVDNRELLTPSDFKKYLEAAQKGNSDAQLFVASCYASGNGTAINMQEAVRWGLKAAEQGCLSPFEIHSGG